MEAFDPMLGIYDPFSSRQGMPFERTELPAQPSSLECAACSPQVTLRPTCQQADVACYASELEQDIAALEEAANRAAAMDWHSPTSNDGFGSCSTGLNKFLSNDLDSYGRHQLVSDSSSDDESDQPEDDMTARIHANARMVQQCGKPMQQGAWKGCMKSAWCDREDRHRGLCNHKATLPGPAACSPLACTPRSEDACSTDDQIEVCYGPHGVQRHQQQQSSGGHSHNCQPKETGDEREVASALKAGPGSSQPSWHEASMPFGCLPSQQQTDADLQQLQHDRPQGLLWDVSGSNSRFAVGEQLFALPAFYQPRVKDLEAPDISTMLSSEGLCSMAAETTNIEVPVVEPVELDELDTSDALETSCQTYAKPSHSSPSSPSYVSPAAKAQSGAFAMPVPVAVVMLPGRNAPTALVAVPSGCLASACLPGMLPLEEVHPPSVPTAAANKPAAASTAHSTGAAGPTSSEVSKPNTELLRRCSSSGSSANHASVEAAATATASAPASSLEPPAAASPKAAASAVKPSAAVNPSKAAIAAAAVAPVAKSCSIEAKLPPPMQRVPRIKHKPRRPDDPPRPLLEPSSSALSSPKTANKKRPAGRMAANPSSEHCCAQCGAVSTPVWRAGPAGPKTLCNACGVRYMKTARRK